MALSAGRAAFKTFLMAQAANTNENQTKEQAVDQFLNALETYIKTATLTIPGTGLAAPSGGGPVTGSSTTGTLT